MGAIAPMSACHIPEALLLWKHTEGVGLRSRDDSPEGLATFLRRNPTTSFVAVVEHMVVGTVLCGHDGRRGHLYHLCVDPNHRRLGLGRRLVEAAVVALRSEGIYKASLVVFSNNQVGSKFWKSLGWQQRTDLTYWDFTLRAQD